MRLGRDWTIYSVVNGKVLFDQGGRRINVIPCRATAQTAAVPDRDELMFVDRVTIFVQGGAGGNGCLSFRREKYAPRGGPNGGDGGHGGSIVIRASEGHTNLAHLSHQRHWKAERGEHGQGSDCFGRGGDDLIIEVPAGTLVRDRDRGNLLRDLKEPGDQVVVARGGKGGHGNTHFKSSTNRAPRQVEKGHPGEERWITMELKVIADAGLIGLAQRRQVNAPVAHFPRSSRDRRLSVHDEVSQSGNSGRVGASISSWPTFPD